MVDPTAGGVAGRIIVVGGAAGGTGHAVCAALSAAGATVVAVASDLERLTSVDASARFACDLGDASAVERLVGDIHDSVGRVDGLVHLPGGWRAGQGDDDFAWLEERVLTTLRVTTRALRDDVAESDAGRMIMIGSTGVDKPTWSNANYVTVKAAAEMWMRTLASSFAKRGTAAAVTLSVAMIGDGGTAVESIADAIVGLWTTPAGDLNGTRIDLV